MYRVDMGATDCTYAVTEWQIEGAMHALVSVPIKSQEAEDRMKERMQRWYMGSLLGCIVNHHRHDAIIEYEDYCYTADYYRDEFILNHDRHDNNRHGHQAAVVSRGFSSSFDLVGLGLDAAIIGAVTWAGK